MDVRWKTWSEVQAANTVLSGGLQGLSWPKQFAYVTHYAQSDLHHAEMMQ